MCNKTGKFIILILLIQFLDCISVPSKPLNEQDACIVDFFQVKRKIKNIQNSNAAQNSGIIFGSWVLAWGYGGDVFMFSLYFIVNQIKNYRESESM